MHAAQLHYTDELTHARVACDRAASFLVESASTRAPLLSIFNLQIATRCVAVGTAEDRETEEREKRMLLHDLKRVLSLLASEIIEAEAAVSIE